VERNGVKGELMLDELAKMEKEMKNCHALDIVSTKSFKSTMDKICPLF
jgi:hypothetical protein